MIYEGAKIPVKEMRGTDDAELCLHPVRYIVSTFSDQRVDENSQGLIVVQT